MELLSDRYALADYLQHNGIGAEVGVQSGEYASVLLSRAHPAQLYLIDCWEPQSIQNEAHWTRLDHFSSMCRVFERFEREIESRRVIVHRGFSVPALAVYPEKFFDWIYIDADHRYQAVLDDLWAASRCIKPGGRIAGHDYVDPKVSRHARECDYGVVKAVEEFCQKAGWEIEALTRGIAFDVDGVDNPSYLLRRKEAV